MSNSFDNIIVYEDRDSVRTSRWKLDGISTKDPGNTAEGWLWYSLAVVSNTATVSVYKTSAGASGDLVAEAASVDVSDLATAAAKATLVAKNESGITGELYIEDYTADVALVPMLTSLCVDKHLANEYTSLANMENYDATIGMADYCAVATGKVLLLASQIYSGQLGGYGALEHRNLSPADRLAPDYRKLASPEQLREAAIHCALGLAFWALHDMVDNTVYSERGERHEAKCQDAVSSWNLAFMSDPDTSHDAGESRSATAVHVERV